MPLFIAFFILVISTAFGCASAIGQESAPATSAEMEKAIAQDMADGSATDDPADISREPARTKAKAKLRAGKAPTKKAAALSAKDVDGVMSKYRKAPAVQAKVKKTVVQEAMGISNVSTGDFYFSKGKLRLDFTEPEKTSLVYDGKFVWLESRMDDSNIQVTKMRTNDLKRSKSVLTALFEKNDILRNFKLIKSSDVGGEKNYFFEPKKKKADDEIQALHVVLKNKELERVSYKDQLENTVSFDFTDLTKGNVPAAKFSYKVPKNAQVTEI